MKKFLVPVCLSFIPLLTLSAFATQPAPIPVQESAVARWREARVGLFIHWGPVTLKGEEISWSRGTKSLPIAEYDALYKQFNPEKFNAADWAAVARDAGMKYVVLTCKHHDGFCLWDTKQTDYNIMNTPFHRDVTRELAAACKKQGMPFGAYYSTCDWYHPDFPLTGRGGKTVRETSNLDRYTVYLKAQLTELLKNYGPLWTLWFDVPQRFDSDRGQGVINHARALQPDLLINNRTGARGDYETPEQRVGGFNLNRPWETCMTLCDQWTWKPDDKMKSLRQCLQTLICTNGGDGNFLLNIGPKPNGEIELRQIERLKEIGTWLGKYGESIYGTRGGPYHPTREYASTRKGHVVYLHLMKWNGDTAELPAFNGEILESSLLTGGKVTIENGPKAMRVKVPVSDQQPIDTIVKLMVKGNAMDLAPIKSALKIRASASNVLKNNPEFGADKAVDNNTDTHWATDPGTHEAWLRLDYPAPTTLSGVIIESATQPCVKKFVIERLDGDQWVPMLQGDSIGGRYNPFHQTFPPVKTQSVRLHILEATEAPAVAEITFE